MVCKNTHYFLICTPFSAFFPKTIRKQSCFTQKELTELSGVTLRMIQAYEQGDQDILKAEAGTVFALSRVLGCAAEVICG